MILRVPVIASEKRVLRGSFHKAYGVNSSLPNELSTGQQENAPQSLREAPDSAALIAQEEQLAERLREADETGKRAYEEGYEAGLRNGETDGREVYTSGLRQLEELTQNMNDTVQRSLDESEDMMVSIVFESVCKIIGDTLTTREGVVAVVEEALARIRGKSSVIIRVNPLDLELIEESAAFGVASEADWRADEGVAMGGCMIESEYGTLDARIDTQLNQLKRVLLSARHKPVDTQRDD
ncbi:Flagellar biosynthesis/type III secretory pathway protein [Solimicrobium silvestre]|uniref:Flagellar assembly protein FliH n=2 Tax=Solimicrobium silvestre TaxID=2099400 RepID=A0A2S9H1R1_9BURK|nr:Flagellar biosynthesis/type III secretory pathway protein [Solimicrobium silvestre]